MAKNKHNKGFTLPELLICVMFLAVLATLSVTRFNRYMEDSRQATDLGNMRAAYSAAAYAYILDPRPGEWYYDTQAGQLAADYVPEGCGNSHARIDGELGWLQNYDVPFSATGIPNVNGRARLLHVSVDENGMVAMDWRDSLDGKAYLASRAEP